MNIRIKNTIKILLDLIMILIFALLLDKSVFGGQSFHEIAGLTIGAFIIVHMVINRKWIKGITKKLLSEKLPTRTKTQYVVDIMLLISLAVIIITGIMMSRFVFSGAFYIHFNVKGLHKASAYIALMLIGIHIGLSWPKVMNMLKNILKLSKKKAMSIFSTAVAIADFAIGAYNIYSTGYFGRIIEENTGYSEKRHIVANTNSYENDYPADAVSFTDASERTTADSNEKSFYGGNGQGKMNGQHAAADKTSEPFSVIFQNISIMAAFSVFTYYADKLIRRNVLRS